MDLIDRCVVVGELKAMFEDCFPDAVEELDVVITTINEIQGVDRNSVKWVSCSERMPEAGVKVLIQCCGLDDADRTLYFQTVGYYAPKYTIRTLDKFGVSCFCEEYDEITQECYYREGWYEEWSCGNGESMSFHITADVIAWMPLPEPYKPEGK